MQNSLNGLAASLESIKSRITRLSGVKEAHDENYRESRRSIKQLEKRQLSIISSVRVIQEVAKETQEKLEYEISEIVTAAIQAIFKEKHSLKIAFEMKRNKTEAEIFVSDEDGNQLNVYNDDGGGLRDIVAMSLRLACWRIKGDKSSPVFLLDEPWKNLSKKYRPAAMDFLKQISHKLNLQIIMVTHVEEYIDEADNVIEIK